VTDASTSSSARWDKNPFDGCGGVETVFEFYLRAVYLFKQPMEDLRRPPFNRPWPAIQFPDDRTLQGIIDAQSTQVRCPVCKVDTQAWWLHALCEENWQPQPCKKIQFYCETCDVTFQEWWKHEAHELGSIADRDRIRFIYGFNTYNLTRWFNYKLHQNQPQPTWGR